MDLDALLERTQWDFFWVPGDVDVVDRPELAFLSCERDQPSLNRVTRTRAPDPVLPRLIDEVCAVHAGVRSQWMVAPRCRTDALERALTAAGYVAAVEHDAFAIDVGAFRAAAGGFVVRRVSDAGKLRDALAVARLAFGVPTDLPVEAFQQALDQCRDPRGRAHRYVAYLDGEPVSAGGLTAYAELGFGLLWGGGTVPEARGRGAYTAVMAARMEMATHLGLDAVGLYARLETSAPVVEHQGFRRGGRMTHWERPAS